MARAWGKLILLGEHAAVYGVPAIAVGLDKGATAVARAEYPGIIRIGDRMAVARDNSELGRGFGALLDAAEIESASVDVTLEMLPGVGLGASAAIAVAAARAVLELTGAGKPGLDRVVEVAMAWERVFHGNPSGVDAWTSAHGGCLLFKRDVDANTATIKPIRVGRRMPLAVCVAGPAASTKGMVEGVARFREKKPDVVNKSLAGIESLVKNATLCIEAGDLIGLGKLLDFNQILLSGLFLSTEELEAACAWAREAGALGAKLTGSGGGGCVIALAEDDPSRILTAWSGRGLPCFASWVEADAPGVGA